MTDVPLLKTPLFDIHEAWGGRMVDFAGWSMPVQFSGIQDEHVHTRTACSLFDVSHMGRLKITGADAQKFLNWICTRNLANTPGRSFYSHICQEDGGILDDVIVSCFEEDVWGIVCNASNREKIIAWLEKHRGDYAVSVTDETMATAMVAVQGPKTLELAESMVGTDLSKIKRYRFVQYELMGMKVIVYRSGYTGEDGFEAVIPAGLAKMLIPQLLGTVDQPNPVVKSAGLGARDTLRLEAGMPLYGHEMNEGVDSLSAGQGWCVDLTKDFIGVEPMRKLEAEGLKRKLVGLEFEGRRIARPGIDIFDEGGKVGEITSGTLSPTLGKSIAMGYVRADRSEEGTELEVELGSSRTKGKVVPLQFYKRPKAS